VKANASAKFDETVEIAMNLGVDPRHADQMVRGVVNLPNGTGKTCASPSSPVARRPMRPRKAGADIVGAEDLMETIQGGTIEFDRCIATPDMMPIVGRLGKVLGPRNLMPNPKVGTVTMDVEAVEAAKGGRCSSRPRRRASSMPASARRPSTRQAGRERPRLRRRGEQGQASGAKGTYMKKVSLSSTMGPGVSIDAGAEGHGSAVCACRQARRSHLPPGTD
jgi:large subunit ribosomal protein L1